MNVGLPFQFLWRPAADVTVEGSYMPITMVHFQTSWCVGGGPLTVFGGYDWTNEGYFLADRVDDRERFYSYAMTLSAGLRYKLTGYGVFELSGGYAFDRFFFQGKSFSDRNHDRVDVDPGPFLGASFRLRF